MRRMLKPNVHIIMIKHTNTKHAKFSVSCEICKKMFESTKYKRNHMKKDHKHEDSNKSALLNDTN